jgi:excisionase family DNA binding protein
MPDKSTIEQLRFPELIDIATLARLLGVGERYVPRMVAERRVPTVKVGHLVRFDLADIREWVQEQRRPPRSELARRITLSPIERRRST